MAASYGLMLLDFALLRPFLERKEWTTTQLAHALPVNVSRVSRRLVTKVVGMGLMRRRSCRRVVMLALTEGGKGLRSLQGGGQLHHAANRRNDFH